MTAFFDPPTLSTINTNPSWLNRSAKVDRSSCFELKVSNLWPYATFETYSKGKREAASDITINARFLIQLSDKHHPHQLQGDSRTTKTNVMRESYQRSALSHQHTGNPNKGATRTKMLGLWEAWRQTIAIERHRLHKNLAQHFLLCPTCNNKYLKLFLPLCTKQEALDADTAEAWLNQLDMHKRMKHTPLPPYLMAHTASLILRYGLLFRNERKLICRKCLNLRYGQVRKKEQP